MFSERGENHACKIRFYYTPSGRESETFVDNPEGELYNCTKQLPERRVSMNNLFTKIVAIILALAMAGSVMVAAIQVLT